MVGKGRVGSGSGYPMIFDGEICKVDLVAKDGEPTTCE